MARTNRISTPDAVYHVTTRIAHRAMLLRDDGVKDKIFHMIYGTALFSGVEVYSCCVMENHLHILVHVPRVPKRLWTDKSAEPDAYAFGMRPPECRSPIWRPQGGGTVPAARPSVGFMLDDGEFEERLAGIYGREGARRRVASWRALENAGCAERAMADRERLCRRMYNVSQFMKTLKERITRLFNSPGPKAGHEGALWQGRFHSGVVEPTAAVMAIVAGYVGYNPVKARIAGSPGGWRWSSFACALGEGPLAETCRRMYGKMLCCTWEEACARMRAIFADRLPDDLAPESLREACERLARRREGPVGVASCEDAVDGSSPSGGAGHGETAEGLAEKEGDYGMPRRIRASQAIRLSLRVFRGAFIGSLAFARRTLLQLPRGFPAPNARSALMCSAFAWEEPPARAA